MAHTQHEVWVESFIMMLNTSSNSIIFLYYCWEKAQAVTWTLTIVASAYSIPQLYTRGFKLASLLSLNILFL